MNRTTLNNLSQVLIDGPNIDMVLGRDILGHRPCGKYRPNWSIFRDYTTANRLSSQPTFVLNGKNFNCDPVFGFARFLKSEGFNVQAPTSGPGDPVDRFIQCRIEAVAQRKSGGHITLVAHDHGYAAYLKSAMGKGTRVTIIGFREYLAPELAMLRVLGADLLDLEHDLGVFGVRLPRLVRAIEHSLM